MQHTINGKEYELSLLESECLDEILHVAEKFKKDKDKCLEWGTFGYTEERRAIFNKMWKILYPR